MEKETDEQIMDRLRIPYSEGEEVYKCPRCNQELCSECNPSQEVDFDTDEDNESLNPHFRNEHVNYNGDNVCPWCYVQLKRKRADNKSKN